MPTTDSRHKLSIWMTAVAFLLVVPFALAIVLAGTIGHGTMSAACGGALVALAPAAVGALLGFVFGIPKTLQSNAPPAADGKAAYQVNTNLEQISDWLTKMLVGVGL